MKTPTPTRPTLAPARRYLAALVSALMSPAGMAASPPPPLIADGVGVELDILPGEYRTDEASRPVLRVANGAKASGGGIVLETTGKNAAAISVSGPQSVVELRKSTIRTTGVAATGIYATGTSDLAVDLEDVSIIVKESSALGVSLSGKSTAGRFKRGSIETHGLVGVGIQALDGSQIGTEGTSILTHGASADGIAVQGTGSFLSATDTRIETEGRSANGVRTFAGAGATLINSDVLTHGDFASALNTGTRSALVTVSGGSLTTTGNDAPVVFSGDDSLISVAGTHMETYGDGSAGIDTRGAAFTVSGGTIATHGISSHGLNAQGGDYPGAPSIRADNVRIVTEKGGAIGALATKSGNISLVESSIATAGTNAHALMASKGRITTRDTDIATTGRGAYGAIILAESTLTVDGGSVSSAQSAALGLYDPDGVVLRNGALLTGGNGAFTEVDPSSTAAFTLLMDSRATGIGDIRLSEEPGPVPPDDTKMSLRIRNAAQWRGATSIVRDLSLESGGLWEMTGNSRVGNLHNNGGVVAFAPSAAGAFGTLTIAGNYEGNDGLFRMRSRLGNDTSPTDLVHVMGDTSGRSLIAVDSLDGAGDYTYDGIQLVRVDGKSDGDFVLSGRAVAGPHEYLLHKGSLSNPVDGDWYLRSSLPPDPPVVVDPGITPPPVLPEPEVVTPPPLPPPPPEPSRLLRPEVGVYRANQTAVLEMFQGGPGGGEDEERNDVHQSVWARFDRRHTAFDIRDELTTTASTSELSLGADLLHSDESAETWLGVMAAAGQADTGARSKLTQYGAKGRVRGAAAGMYAGLRTDNGSYLRGWVQYARFNERVEGDALPSERYGSNTITTSVEAGHRWKMALNRDTDVYLEPQAQIIGTRLHGGDHTEANGTAVDPMQASGVTGRIGLRSAARWKTPGGHVAAPYFAASWLRRLGHLDATAFNGESFGGGVPRNAYALKLGVTFLRSTGWRMWTDVESRFGTRGYRRVTGSIGVRRAW